MSKVHDFYGRYLFTRILGLARYCFKQSLPSSLLKCIDWSTLSEATQTLIDLGIKTEFIPDLVYSIELVLANGTRTTVYLLIELKSSPDKKVAVQVVGYTVRISEKTLLPTYPMILYTGQKNWQILNYWQVIAGGHPELTEPSVNHRIDSMHLWQISETDLLSYENYGVILLLIKHIRKLHDETRLRTIFDGFHKLITVGKDLEVIWSIEYALAVENNGITTERLQEFEDKHFFNIPKENRVMPKFAISTDVAEQRGREQGLEQGLERGRRQEREQVILAMLRSKMAERDICKIVGISVDELAKIKKKI